MEWVDAHVQLAFLLAEDTRCEIGTGIDRTLERKTAEISTISDSPPVIYAKLCLLDQVMLTNYA
jgi:hypothetical protein